MERPAPQHHAAAVWLVAAVVAAALLALGEWLVPAATQPFGVGNNGHGLLFAQMAKDPFALEGPFPQRKLWPLLAWLASFAGVSAVQFSRVCSGALLVVVFWFAHRRTGRWDRSLLVTAVVAVSGAVLVYQPMTCFSDPLNLLLMVLLVHFAARPRVFWPLVFVSALSHELVFFFWPWLLYLRCTNGGGVRREALLLAVTLGAYLLYRAPMRGSYDMAYYYDHNLWVPWLLPAVWALWSLVVVVEFGPLLALAGFGLGRGGALTRPDGLGGRWGPWLYVAGVLPLMLLAYDVMRFATFAFLPVLLGAIAATRTARGRWVVLGLVAAACGTYAWLHPNPAEQGGRHFTAVSLDLFFDRVVPRIAEHQLGPGPFPLDHALAVLGEMAANWWGTFTIALGAAALLLVGGRAARRAGG